MLIFAALGTGLKIDGLSKQRGVIFLGFRTISRREATVGKRIEGNVGLARECLVDIWLAGLGLASLLA